ncbi:response regulator [Sulfuricystis multivorans]|uniref:response regulator n=1 Tax=Sulfuricystis multivorans TaxID=2211108 RepID=UPI000F84B205|nr:response regulator [Sulfuricystis multivorans]
MKRKTLPLAVDLLGVNERMRNTFAMAFAGPAKAVARLADGGRADLVIVDADGVGAQEAWQAFHEKRPRCPAIAISAAGIELEGVAATIAKPIRVEQLIETIRRLAEQIEPDTQKTPPLPLAASIPAPQVAPSSGLAAETENEEKTQRIPTLRLHQREPETSESPATPPGKDLSAVCGTVEDIDCNDDAQVSKLFLPLEGRLLAALQTALAEAKQGKQPVALRYKENTLAIFHPRGRAVAVPVGDASLQRMSQAAFPGGMLFLEKLPADSASAPGPMAVHPDVLLWKVAAWTYRGRLPVDLPPNVRVYLRHWPNLTRLLELPDAMRIAALLNEQPMSMSRVAEALQIPQRHVFAFCACAHTIGLLDIAKRAADHLIEPPPAPPEHGERQFLGRIMHYLKGLMTR